MVDETCAFRAFRTSLEVGPCVFQVLRTDIEIAPLGRSELARSRRTWLELP